MHSGSGSAKAKSSGFMRFRFQFQFHNTGLNVGDVSGADRVRIRGLNLRE